MLTIICPECGKTLIVPKEYLLKWGTCRHCKKKIQIVVPTVKISSEVYDVPDKSSIDSNVKNRVIPNQPVEIIENELRKCPFCAEIVSSEALICKHCKSTISNNQFIVGKNSFIKEAGGYLNSYQPSAVYSPTTQTMAFLSIVFSIISWFIFGIFFSTIAFTLGAIAGFRGSLLGWLGMILGLISMILSILAFWFLLFASPL